MGVYENRGMAKIEPPNGRIPFRFVVLGLGLKDPNKVPLMSETLSSAEILATKESIQHPLPGCTS